MENHNHHSEGGESKRHSEDSEPKDGELVYEDESEENAEKKDEKTHEKKHVNNVELKLSFTRRALVLISIFVLLLIFALVGWKYKIFDNAVNWYSSATVSAKVIEKDTNLPLESVSVAINGVSAKSDAQGLLTIKDLQSGTVIITVTKDGYIAKSYEAKLYRGINPLPDIILEKAPDKLYSLTGSVTDAFDGIAIAKVKITSADSDTLTDEKGVFTLQVKASDAKIIISKDAYLATEASAVFNTDQTFENLKIELYPSLKVVFEQEKSGKIDLYQVGSDGKTVTALSEGKGVYSSKSPILSPDGTKFVFLSDRDNPSASSQSLRLYLRDAKGNVSKLSDDANPSRIKWLSNDVVVYSYYAVSSPSQSAVISLNTLTKTRTALTKLPSSDKNISITIGALSVGPDNQHVAWSQSSYSNNSTSSAEITTLTNDSKGLFSAKGDGSDYKHLTTDSSYISSLYFSGSNDLHYAYYENSGYVYKTTNINSGQTSVSAKTIWDREYSFSYGYDGQSDYLGVSTLTTADGSFVYIDTRNGKTDVFIADKDGKNETQITNLGTVKGISLSSDQKYILVGIRTETETSLYGVGIKGGVAKKITECYSQYAGFIK